MGWICKPLKQGGMGFNGFEDINLALIAKLAWWILSGKNCLCVELVVVKYKVRSSWLTATQKTRTSWIWKSIEDARTLLQKRACKLVGSGESILVWEDPWLPNEPGFSPCPASQQGDSCLVVSQLMNQMKTGWNVTKLQQLFDQYQQSWKFQFGTVAKQTDGAWTNSVNGQFSVKTAYNLIMESDGRNSADSFKRKIWKTKLHHRLKLQLWRIASD